MFDRVVRVLETEFSFDGDKDAARRYFLELRQLFVDANYLKIDSEEFKQQEKAVEKKIAERAIGE